MDRFPKDNPDPVKRKKSCLFFFRKRSFYKEPAGRPVSSGYFCIFRRLTVKSFEP